MGYRDNNDLEMELKRSYQVDIDSLKKADSFEGLDSLLGRMGFEREEKIRSNVYTRENGDITEILSEYPLDEILSADPQQGGEDWKMTFYQIPAGQDVQEWYKNKVDSFSLGYKTYKGMKAGLITGFAAIEAIMLSLAIERAYDMDFSTMFLSIGLLSYFAYENAKEIRQWEEKFTKDKSKKVAEGIKVLQHIPTSFEKYKQNKLRIEEPKLRIEDNQEAEEGADEEETLQLENGI